MSAAAIDRAAQIIDHNLGAAPSELFYFKSYGDHRDLHSFPTRRSSDLQNKNPRGWAEFAAALGGHSALGSALTMRGVQAARPSLYDLRDELGRAGTPVLLLVGDEDEGCLDAALMLKRTMPSAGLAILPWTGHTANLEEPEQFNALVDRFLAAVERGAWRPRDPRSLSASTTGMA